SCGWSAQPPHRPKYGHCGATRFGELCLTSTSSASANCFFSRTISAETSSPSIVYGTNTAFPCSRATPFPPNATSSIFRSTARMRRTYQRPTLPCNGALDSGLEVVELDGFDQMLGKPGLQTSFDIAVIAKTADCNSWNAGDRAQLHH